MGRVSDAVAARVLEQIERHTIVVWYDPDRIYISVAATLEERGVPVERYEGSFFELRHRAERYIRDETPDRLLVYVPLGREETTHALVELESLGVVMRPGQQPPSRNPRLAVVAREVLEASLPQEQAREILRRVELGELGLAELDRLVEGGPQGFPAVAALFGTADPAQVTLLFLANSERDRELVAREALDELERFFEHHLGVPPTGSDRPDDVRASLRRKIFEADLAASLESSPRAGELSLWRPAREECRGLACEVIGRWRDSDRLRPSLLEAAEEEQRRYRDRLAALPADVLAGVETFPVVDEILLGHVEQQLLDGETRNRVDDLISARRRGFWAGTIGELGARWAMLALAQEVLQRSADLTARLAESAGDMNLLTELYVAETPGDATAVWRLDAAYRRLEEIYHTEALDLEGDALERLERVVVKLQQTYAVALEALADRYLEALPGAGFRIEGTVRQREVFGRFVGAGLEEGKVAYILVDGLRYEMGAEVAEALHRGDIGEVRLHVCQAQLPTITTVGMAALMPYADQSPELVVERDRVALRIAGATLRDRADRVTHLERSVQGTVETCKLSDLLPVRQALRRRLRNADLVLVTATEELDGLCEQGNLPMAHRLMGDVLAQLPRTVRALVREGFTRVVITADHGFLLREPLDTGATIDPPGGHTVELHRRVWIGRGGSSAPGFVRFKAQDVGLGGDLELAFPRGLGGFARPGPRPGYLHGGASPQELLVPVIDIRAKEHRGISEEAVEWTLQLGGSAISSPFVSVHISGRRRTLFLEGPLHVRVEIWDGEKKISRLVSAHYGDVSETEEVEMVPEPSSGDLRPNAVVLQLTARPGEAVTVRLVDAQTDAVLHVLQDVPVRITDY